MATRSAYLLQATCQGRLLLCKLALGTVSISLTCTYTGSGFLAV